MADVVRPGDFPGRLAGITPLQGLTLLVGGELGPAAHLHAAGLGEPAALACARTDQPLSLSAVYFDKEIFS